jgi:ATP-binding cassette, subfamily B, bacterial
MRLMAGERRVARLAGFRARWYWLGTAGWIAWFVTPLGPGWLISKVFDELQRHGSTTRFWWLLVGLTAAHVGTALLIMAAHRTYIQGVEAAKALARVNVVAAQLASGGDAAGPRTVPVGDVLSRLRDDPHDVIFLLDNWVDLLGSLLYGVGAAVLLARIDPWATLAGIGPMILAGFANRQIGSFARRYRQRSRDASSAVGDFLTASITASLTVKVAGAQPDVLRRLDELNAQRAKTAVLDQTWGEVVWTVNSAMADAFVGLALVVAARRGLTVGQITLFASYLTGLVWLPMRLGGVVVGRRRYQVSARRLDALVGPSGDGVDRLTEGRPLPILHGPAAARPVLGARVPLERLEVRGLALAARGLADIGFTIERGSLVIVAGPVGSGKTSLLRALIGLLPIDEGDVLWNGKPVHDRAAFFTPPQSAYVSQVPRLFAESLADNLRLGHALSDDAVRQAIELAAFERDVADLRSGLDTLVGARGVRLSGGQAQRAAAARALAHQPELLVLDDLTSALDVETELALWDRLSAAGFTVLAASNRPVALARADQVIRLEASERITPSDEASITAV